ncbi:hypothetical protein COCMIDRAFT_32063 [Bipolaris oryzae ATCC 44560]|uniref:Uncharacterized protein n=1 Tax=Bipolaris oryzae ATCC 44560 TaxID=930090 RepID=W7A3E4_COCMI|nr:uncharacterized protein COCMIDRAFT_32063 [Bipolaris oryzae ATCC 44560]EUC50541.1 hypothetical protein COCMIDRAFT_32063 [Bipolaris oryzae ATCC 44560]
MMQSLLTRGDKDKVPAELTGALSLLRLSDLEGLEERFLATNAFLKPWAMFRDSLFLVKPGAITATTAVATNDDDRGGISRTDLLWFYTQFDQDTYRHHSSVDTSSISCAIDKRDWRVKEYEKHLFAWLLQTFKVGKAHNPWGFDYFQLRNICTAWQAVFVPIVDAVRASYSIKGRRHYGRLALFVEERCPSGLAFPKENVNLPPGNLISSTSYRVLLMPKGTNESGVLTRKHYDETERELRSVYPQYGGLVERPRFKQKMEVWLEEQRARANLRKAVERTNETKRTQLDVVKRDDRRTPVKKILSSKDDIDPEKECGASPIKRYSNSLRRSLSRSVSKQMAREEPKSPLHGVTRQLFIPEDPPSPDLLNGQTHSNIELDVSYASTHSSSTTIVTPWPRMDTQRKSSEQSVYNSVRISSSFNPSNETQTLQAYAKTNGPESLSEDQITALLHPLHRSRSTQREQQGACTPASDQKSHAELHIPSNNGSEWEKDPLLGNLEAARRNTGRALEPKRPAKPPTRLPGPIKPMPYTGHLRVASENNSRTILPKSPGGPDTGLPQPVAWPGTSPTNTSVLSCVNNENNFAPPVPTKSPMRGGNTRGYTGIPQSQQRIRFGPDRDLTRIVSKENIRAALGGHSRDNSEEGDLPPLSRPVCSNQDAVANSGVTVLQTFNTHMFPRKKTRNGTPVGAWVGAPKNRNATGESY